MATAMNHGLRHMPQDSGMCFRALEYICVWDHDSLRWPYICYERYYAIEMNNDLSPFIKLPTRKFTILYLS